MEKILYDDTFALYRMTYYNSGGRPPDHLLIMCHGKTIQDQSLSARSRTYFYCPEGERLETSFTKMMLDLHVERLRHDETQVGESMPNYELGGDSQTEKDIQGFDSRFPTRTYCDVLTVTSKRNADLRSAFQFLDRHGLHYSIMHCAFCRKYGRSCMSCFR